MKPKLEWRKGPDFAEVAEALSIDTSQVLMVVGGQTLVVFYTPDKDGKPPLWKGVLRRDEDDVLRLIAEPDETDIDFGRREDE